MWRFVRSVSRGEKPSRNKIGPEPLKQLPKAVRLGQQPLAENEP